MSQQSSSSEEIKSQSSGSNYRKACKQKANPYPETNENASSLINKNDERLFGDIVDEQQILHQSGGHQSIAGEENKNLHQLSSENELAKIDLASFKEKCENFTQNESDLEAKAMEQLPNMHEPKELNQSVNPIISEENKSQIVTPIQIPLEPEIEQTVGNTNGKLFLNMIDKPLKSFRRKFIKEAKKFTEILNNEIQQSAESENLPLKRPLANISQEELDITFLYYLRQIRGKFDKWKHDIINEL